MLELEAPSFLSAITQLRQIIVVLGPEKPDAITLGDRPLIVAQLDKLNHELNKAGARSALAASNRLRLRANDPSFEMKHGDVLRSMHDIESRFADHVQDIRLFVLQPAEAALMESADKLLAFDGRPVEGFPHAFPNSALEMEEASKCWAFGRSTAAVFHSMRATECGIKALAAFLDIPDPTKAAEKNWGIILNAIRTKIDQKWPKNGRLPNTVGAEMESLYALLEAIKNPWRNATMHVETIYLPHEAIHIVRCVGMFMLRLAKHCDEEGRSPDQSPATVEQSEMEIGRG
ncbi:MAG: hypothetical protein AB7F76_07885 [Parvibaculaceae bacterium]